METTQTIKLFSFLNLPSSMPTSNCVYHFIFIFYFFYIFINFE